MISVSLRLKRILFACPEPVGSNTWQTQPSASEMSMFGEMPSFTREPAQWLFQQDFWLNMKLAERESWLQHRESVAMQHEDVLFLRTLERSHMEQQDVIEMSHYHWDNLDHLMEYQHAWRILGGGAVSRLGWKQSAEGSSIRPGRPCGRCSCSKDQVSGWWHQALRQMLVSEVSNFVVAFRHLHRHISDVWI